MIEERAIHHKLLSKCKKGHVNGPYTKKKHTNPRVLLKIVIPNIKKNVSLFTKK